MREEENEIHEIKKSDDNLAKIAISKEADRGLVDIVSRVNAGFDAGRATKQEIASQIIIRFARDFNQNHVQEFRAQFFDALLLMEATLKRAKETGELPDELRDLLFSQFVASAQPIKKPKKSLNQDIIKDNIDSKLEAA